MTSPKPLSSPYLTWAKAHHGVELNLASSGVKPPPLEALGPTDEDWALDEDHEDGWFPLLERVAHRYRVSADQVALAQGCSMANHLVCARFLEPGDHALVEHPVYEPLHLLPAFFHAEVSFFDRGEADLDVEALAESLTPRTRLVIVSNLHNPTGQLATRERLEELAALAEKKDFHVMVDEVYLEWLLDEGETTALAISPRFVTTRSLTKAYGLDAVRAGWILAEPTIAEDIRRLMDLYSVKMAHASERLAARAIDHAEALLAPAKERLGSNRALVRRFVESHERLRWNEPPAGSVGFVLTEGLDIDALVSACEARGTLIAPGRFFGVPGAFRIGFGMERAKLVEGLSRLGEAIADVG